MKISLISLVSFALLSSCSFKKKELANQVQNGHEELYSRPAAPEVPAQSETKRILIAATNDIGGMLGSSAVKIRDQHNKDPLHIEIGGVDYLAGYLKILRQKYPAMVLVDSGDFLPGDPDNYRHVQDFFSHFQYEAISPGLSDFSSRFSGDTNPVRKFAQTSGVPVITSNLYELKSARAIEWKGIAPYHISTVNGVKIGFIGLLPDDFSKLIPVNNRVGLYIEDNLKSTLHQARRLRSLGAQVIVVLTHQGLDCGSKIAEATHLPLAKVNFEPEANGVCNLTSPMGQYLERLPRGLVDVVVGGRNHQKVANFVNGIAVVSGFDSGKSLSLVEIEVDPKTGKVLGDKTSIHQPVMICREFFKETNDCFTEDPSVNHKERIPAKFLGEEVMPDEELRKKFSQFFDEVAWQAPDHTEVRKKYQADISFLPPTSGSTHLVVIELTGSELAQWLDESFNTGEGELWSPDTFSRENENLLLKVSGEQLAHSRRYKVLTDLESLQTRPQLVKFIVSEKLTSLTTESWNRSGIVDELGLSYSGIRKE